jgi:phosphoglycerate dehydrogenase-like enzyme
MEKSTIGEFMNIILLRDPISPEEFYKLQTEFPHYKFISFVGEPLDKLEKDQLSSIEIYYGHYLSVEELNLLPLLRWVHVTSPYLDEMCLKEIQARENIMITKAENFSFGQVGEFALAATLAFCKNLFRWKTADKDPHSISNMALKKSMWSPNHHIFLQIGLDAVGTEIAHKAQREGFNVWGAKEKSSFHPYCNKVYPFSELTGCIPNADVISISISEEIEKPLLKKEEFSLMKEDSILLIFGSPSSVDIRSLAELLESSNKKFRGILIDAHFKTGLPTESTFWNAPEVLITPEASLYPKHQENPPFRLFVYNLRQFIHGNLSEMKIVVGD